MAVYKEGINDKSSLVRVNGKLLKEYALWTGMFERCSIRGAIKCPAYSGCTMSENFKNYSFFYEWCNKQIGFNLKDEDGKTWHLDKDILIKGNKLYSEGTCVFVPPEINAVFLNRKALRGDYPVGVHLCKITGRYRAALNIGKGMNKKLGRFRTVEDAFAAYKEAKESLIKSLAEKWKDKIDNRLYLAMMCYTIEITD
jgi:hypothetical protein